MEQDPPFWKQAAIFILELVFIVNVIVIDIVLFEQLGKETTPKAATTTPQIAPTQTTILNPLPTTQPTNTPAPTAMQAQQTTQTVTSGVKEYYVPLGSGENQSQTYQGISGAQAYANSANYPAIKTVTFEASVGIPTGNETAWIELYDVTQGHPVWNSEMSWEGGDTKYLISPPISLDSGNNLYQVQMKTQLPYNALLNQSTIHIILQ